MKTTETKVDNSNGTISFNWTCKMSDISYGDFEDNIHCNHYEKNFYKKYKDNSFSIPIVNNKPDFCKVNKIIVVEEIQLQRDDNTPCQYCDKIIKEFADDSDNTCKQCILDIEKGMNENIIIKDKGTTFDKI